LRALVDEYGDVARFRIGRTNVIQLSNPEHIHRVLVRDASSFVKAGALKRASAVLGNGLVAADGELHKKQRALLQPAFSRSNLDAYVDVMVKSASIASEAWIADSQLETSRAMQGITLDIITKTLFGSDVRSKHERLEEALTCVLEHFDFLMSPTAWLLKWVDWPRRRKYQQAVHLLDTVVAEMSEETHSRGPQGILVSLLRQVRDSATMSVSPRQVRDEMITLLTAGHETIATALTWTLFLLASHPNVQFELCSKLDQVLDGRDPTLDDVQSLDFVRMALAEAMRLFPPVWAITRRCVEDYSVDGYFIPKGSLIGMSQFIVHRDSRFFERPHDFIPERWNGLPESRALRAGYFPFGAGPRVCIGESFAWMEGILVLATLCRRWWFEPVENPSTIELQPLLTLRPKGGLQLRLRDRRQDSTICCDTKPVQREHAFHS
jgi:cytochrome P450